VSSPPTAQDPGERVLSGYLQLGLRLGRHIEGLVDCWFGDPTLAAAVSADGPPTTLPADADFGAGGDTARRAYKSSWSLAAFVASEYGEQRLAELYRVLAQGKASDAQLDGRIRDVLGVDTDEFARSWGEWVAKQLV